jgi:hypothetical protein
VSTLNIKNFKEEFSLDAIIKSLADKGYDYIDKVNRADINFVTEDGAQMMSVDICRGNDYTNEYFQTEGTLLKKIPNLDRAIYLVMQPQSILPKHVDDDSKEFIRITSGVLAASNQLEDICFTIEDWNICLYENISVGFEAAYKEHKGYNNTDFPWILLVLLIDRDNITEIANYV